MANEILNATYDLWLESEEYHSESMLEGEAYRQKMEEIKGIVGEKLLRDISDHIASFACDVETAAFEQGFRRGILFMSEMIKGNQK